MKVYIDGLSPNKIKMTNIQHFFDKKCEVKTYYTLDGIFENTCDKLYQLNFKDMMVEKRQLKGVDVNLVVDRSSVIREQIAYQIPPDHEVDRYTKETYLIRRGSKLVLTIHRKGNAIVDVYIETGENLDNEHYHEDFATLISLLTNIN